MEGMRSWHAVFLALPALALLAGCTSSSGTDYEAFLQKWGAEIVDDRTFTVCQGYGCAVRSPVNLSDSEWRRVRRLFTAPASDAAEERVRLAKAVGLLERIVGRRAGTSGDVGGTIEGFGKPGQLDCIDESANTTIYLSLLARDRLLNWHTLRSPALRGPISGACCWPHQSAVVMEVGSGQSYAVDSWFHDNGVPAEIVPLPDWLSGWMPRESLRLSL